MNRNREGARFTRGGVHSDFSEFTVVLAALAVFAHPANEVSTAIRVSKSPRE
jgi:hypothetical protein